MAAATKPRLSGKQKAFIEHYLANGFNGTAAARAAGYKGNDVTLASVAHENLRKPQIKAEIDARMKALVMSADEALFRLSQQGRGRVTDFLGLTIDELKAHPQAHLLHKVKHTRRYIPSLEEDKPDPIEEKIEYEIYNAQSALALILKEQHLAAGEPTEGVLGVIFNPVPARPTADSVA